MLESKGGKQKLFLLFDARITVAPALTLKALNH
jgi:hypothetical protein